MFNKHLTGKDALILIGLFLVGVGLALLTLHLDPDVMDLRPWLESMGIFVLALAAIAPQGDSATNLNDVSFHGLAFSALSFVYWIVLCGMVFPFRKRIIRRRDLERRRRQKEAADRVLVRNPDAFPLPEDLERNKQ